MLKVKIVASRLWQLSLSQDIPVPIVLEIPQLNQTLQTKSQTCNIGNEIGCELPLQAPHHIHMSNFLEHYHYGVGRTFR